MDQTIRVKRNYIKGSIPQSLEEGELAVNVADRYIYVSNESGDTIRLYGNATKDSDGLLSSLDKEKIDKIITTGNGNSFLSNSGEYKSIVSSIVLDYTTDLVSFSGTVSEEVVQNLQDAIVEKIPIFITIGNTIQYIAFATQTDTDIVLTTDSITSSTITSVTATINIGSRVISATSSSSDLSHPIILLNYTDDLKNGNLGESVSQEVSQKLLDAISGGWACVVKSGQSDILCNLQKVGSVVTIVMESITKIGEEYFGATTIIGVNTDTNTISHSDSGGLFLVDKEKVLLKDNTTEYTPVEDYNPATKKYVDDTLGNTIKTDGTSSQYLGGDGQYHNILEYDDIIDVYATYDITERGDVNNIHLYSDEEHLEEITTGSAKTIYLDITTDNPGYQFKWSGTSFIKVGGTNLILGTTTGTAFEGSAGKELQDKVAKLPGYVVGAASNTGMYLTHSEDGKYELHVKASAVNSSLTSSIEDILELTEATTTESGVMSASDKEKLDKVITNGDGNSYLANDGTYKTITISGSTLSEDYAPSDLVNDQLEPKPGDTIETAIGKLHKSILDNEEVVATAFSNIQTVLGVENPGQVMPNLSDTNYLSGQTQFVSALKALDAALKVVADQANTITDLTARVVALEDALTIKNV